MICLKLLLSVAVLATPTPTSAFTIPLQASSSSFPLSSTRHDGVNSKTTTLMMVTSNRMTVPAPMSFLPTMEPTEVESLEGYTKYGAFHISPDGIAHWKRNNTVCITMQIEDSPSEHCYSEGWYIPPDKKYCRHPPSYTRFDIGAAAACLWGKWDCTITLNKSTRKKGPLELSLAHSIGRVEARRKLRKGFYIEKLVQSKDPLGPYQTRTIQWQADIVKRYGMKKVYYLLPLYEYCHTLQDLLGEWIPSAVMDEMRALLKDNHDVIKEYVKDTVDDAEIEFVYPLRDGLAENAIESYKWPFKYLDDVDMTMYEMEEIRTAYECVNDKFVIPPTLLGRMSRDRLFDVKRQHNNAAVRTWGRDDFPFEN